MKWIFLLLIFSINTLAVKAQEATVRLGPDEIGVNQVWTIVVSVKNGRIRSYDNIPEIPGFRKRGTSSQMSTSMINGQVSSEESIVMNYTPMKEGVVTVPNFTITVNGTPIKAPGKKVKVGPAVQQRRSDPFQNHFDRPSDDFFGNEEPEFVEVTDDALLLLQTSKSEVYVGEGFSATLSFLIADNNRAHLQFHDLDKQLSGILKKLRPANCWEENFTLESIEGAPVTINGKHYVQYKIHQAMYYPFNTEAIRFPSLALEMIKFKVAKNPSFFGRNRQEDFKTYTSAPKTVNVKALPPHPLSNSVAVGDYKLREKINDIHLQTGTSASYEFNIFGEGNVAAIQKPKVSGDESFEIYDPAVHQEISKDRNRLTGTKSFRYFMIPREPGQFKLGNYFFWVFFNPNTAKYDTLRSQVVVDVKGESKKNEAILSSDQGSFYDKIDLAGNVLQNRASGTWSFWLFTGFIVAMIGGSATLLLKK
jgi:hypothetical protein